jgi:hypothetical protein
MRAMNVSRLRSVRVKTGAVIGLLVLLLAACSADDTGSVRPFSDIAVADPVVEVDPSGTVATLRVDTTIDAVCAVSYGIDSPSGALATDRDMGVGGHSEHEAVMTGLEPNTTYQYRLQGVGADGAVYQSETYTFTTPEADPSMAAPGENVALGATVAEVSSEFSDQFAAENAFDGDLGTEWSTAGDGDDAFVTVDLGATIDVSAIRFRTRSMSDGSSTTETFTVSVADQVYGPFEAGPEPSEVDISGRFLTFSVETSTGGNTGAVEIEVFSD